MTLLKKRYVKRELEVETAAYSKEVPFYKPLTICEHTMILNDDITPYNPTGLKDFKEPIPGYAAMYRLIGDGSHTPTFTGWNKSAGSQTWSATLAAVNLVTFWFDGVEFWYSIDQPA